MLTIREKPNELILAGNPAFVEVSSDKAPATDYKVVNDITFGNPHVLNSSLASNAFAFSIKFLNFNIQWWVDSQWTLANQIPDVFGYTNNVGNFDQWLAVVAAKFNANKYLSTFFTITANTEVEKIVLAAKYSGDKYKVQIVLNRVTNVSVEYSIPGYGVTPFYSYADIGLMLVKDSLPVLIENTPVNKIARFDVSKYVRKSKNGHFNYPPSSNFITIRDLVDTFTYMPIESFGGYTNVWEYGPNVGWSNQIWHDIQQNFGTTSAEIAVLQGEMSETRAANLAKMGYDILNYLTESKSFLTFAPLRKITDIYAPEKLNWLALAAGNYKLFAKKKFKCIDKTVLLASFTIEKFQVAELEASFYKVCGDELSKVYEYDLWIEDSAENKVTEVRTFTIVRKFENYARYFLAKNSFGVYECFRSHGKCEKEVQIDKQFQAIENTSLAASTARRWKQTSREISNKFKVNSGNLDKNHLAWMQELLASDDALYLRNGFAYPVKLPSVKVTPEKDSEFVNSIDFALEGLAHDDFSNEFVQDSPILPDFNTDFNNDFNSLVPQGQLDYLPIANAGDSITFPNSPSVGNFHATAAPPEMEGTWTLISGPPTVSIVNIHNPVTTVSFTESGNYIFRWTVVYGRCSEFDDVAVVVVIDDVVVPISAGDDVEVTGRVATIHGYADIPCIWDMISGPGTIAFADEESLITQVTASQYGQYVLRLSGGGQTDTMNLNCVLPFLETDFSDWDDFETYVTGDTDKWNGLPKPYGTLVDGHLHIENAETATWHDITVNEDFYPLIVDQGYKVTIQLQISANAVFMIVAPGTDERIILGSESTELQTIDWFFNAQAYRWLKFGMRSANGSLATGDVYSIAIAEWNEI